MIKKLIILASITSILFVVSCSAQNEESSGLLQSGSKKEITVSDQIIDICEKYATSYTEAKGIADNSVKSNSSYINLVSQYQTYLKSLNTFSNDFIDDYDKIVMEKSDDINAREIYIEQMKKIINASKQLINAIEPALEDNEIDPNEFNDFSEASNQVSSQIDIHSGTIDTVMQSSYDILPGNCNAWYEPKN